jgi:hypothetical protein
VVMGSNPGKFPPPMQLPCYFTLYKELLYQSCVFFKVYYHSSVYAPILSGTSVCPIKQVHLSAMLVLLIVGN